LQALSKQVKALRKFDQQLSGKLDEGFVLSEGPEGHFTATFILTNGRLAGQQIFWNGSGTGKYRDFRSILTIFPTRSLSRHISIFSPDRAASGVGAAIPATQNGSMTRHIGSATRPVH